MRLSCLVAIGLMCGLLCGCEENQTAGGDGKNLDVELVNTLNNVQVENAIIAQHTLYPYHFVAGGEKLNELGQRDFAVLAKHFTEHPGILNVRRGETAAELYDARVAQVLSQLKEAGIEMGLMSVSDAMPGGPGMPAERVVTIVQEEGTVSTRATTSSSGMITQR